MSYDIFGRVKLTKEEEEDIAALEKNFHVVAEDEGDYNYMSSRRVVVSKEWAKKLLVLSFCMNIVSTILVFSCIFILITKPNPKYYGSTPSGIVIPLKQINN
jgi:hypothetical protein